MAWKGNCKQLDLLVWSMTGNDDTLFLAEAQFWINPSQEQKVNTRLEQMQKLV